MSVSYDGRTVLFVDICGSTQLYETLGDERASVQVLHCLEMLGRLVEASCGRVIQRIGDELMCSFDCPDDALESARAMQEWVGGDDVHDQPALAIRIGCHHGPVLEEDGDLFGDCVNVAARTAAFARAGQVILTEDVAVRLASAKRGDVRSLGTFSIRGKRQDMNLYELLWHDSEDTATATATRSFLAQPARLFLKYAGGERCLDSRDRLSIMLGRDASCEVSIPDPKASRRHARIETRRDKFVLIDQSVNGTYVIIADRDQIVLRREELILYASGRISLGHRAREGHGEVLEFSCA